MNDKTIEMLKTLLDQLAVYHAVEDWKAVVESAEAAYKVLFVAARFAEEMDKSAKVVRYNQTTRE